jgi:4-amino-4-deoxy-L-arabinose transferase-like glycosyltransferase
VWTNDEPRDAGIAREMWRAAWWTVPHLSGKPFLEKPPLYWWAQIGLFEAFGRSDAGLARVPSAVFCFAALLLTYALGRRYFTTDACLLGGLVLLTTVIFVYRSHWIIVDTALVFSTTGTLACFAHALGRTGLSRSVLLAGMYVFAALAFFSKGLVGVGIPAAGALVYLVWTRRLREFLGWHLIAGGLGVAALVALWLWRVSVVAGADGLYAFLVYNQFGRLFPGQIARYAGGHERSPLYYLGHTPVDLLPWTPLVLLAVVDAWRIRGRVVESEREGIQFLAAVAGTVVVVLSLSGTKRDLYMLPIVPLVALLTGWWMSARIDRGPWKRGIERVWGLIVQVAAVLLPGLTLVLAPGFWPRVVAGVVLTAAVARRVHNLPAFTRAESWLGVLVVASLGWSASLVTVFPAADTGKSYRALAAELVRLVPPDETIYGYMPSETIRGLMAFYSDHRYVPVNSLRRVRKLAAGPGHVWMVNGEGDQRDIVAAGIPHRVEGTVDPKWGRGLFIVRLGRFTD